MQTINVIEYANDEILQVKAYEDSPEGNEEAQTCFKTIIKEHTSEVTDEELEGFIEEGYHEQGDYQLFLTHSS